MTEQFQLNSQTLASFIQHLPQPAHLNRVSNGELIESNAIGQVFLANYEVNHIILSKNINHLTANTSNNLGPDDNLATLMDTQLLLTGEAVTEHECIILDKNGRLNFYSIVKLPIHDYSSKILSQSQSIQNQNISRHQSEIAAILTIYFKSERAFTPVELYQYYKLLGHDRKIAVQCLLAHFNILDYFAEALTEKELLCLLHMRINTSHKTLAAKLLVSKKTVETHISRLLQKSKQHDLSNILNCLRRDK